MSKISISDEGLVNVRFVILRVTYVLLYKCLDSLTTQLLHPLLLVPTTLWSTAEQFHGLEVSL